jgi:hypothetical protein
LSYNIELPAIKKQVEVSYEIHLITF